MSTTSDFLGDSATPRTIAHGGKTYAVGRLTHSRMEAYGAWLEGWVRERLVRIYGHDQALLAAKLAELEKDALAGLYEFEGQLVLGKEVWKEEERVIKGEKVKGEARGIEGGVLHTHRGRVALLATLCGCTFDEALDLVLAHPAEVAHLLELTLKESLPAPQAREDWRPLGNGQRPAEAPPA